MSRRASSVMAPAEMLKRFQKHGNIKYLENGLPRHATRVFLKYTSTGDMQKTPLWNQPASIVFIRLAQRRGISVPVVCRNTQRHKPLPHSAPPYAAAANARGHRPTTADPTATPTINAQLDLAKSPGVCLPSERSFIFVAS